MSKLLTFFILTLFSLNGLAIEEKKDSSWVFFDLGNTLIDTTNREKMVYMPGAREFIKLLLRQGFKLGLISNIPEKFGTNYTEKVFSLKKYIQKNWSEDIPFNWKDFSKIIIPIENKERKPAPILFARAFTMASGCPILYIGETIDELDMADSLGMATYLIDKDKLAFDEQIYPTKLETKKLVKKYHHRIPSRCNI